MPASSSEVATKEGPSTGNPGSCTSELFQPGTWGVVTNPGAGTPNRFARKWNATLSAVGQSRHEPDGSSWTQTAGNIQGWLYGTPSTDADLYLERWNGTAWDTVASSATTSNQERVIFNGSAGTYRFRVYAFSGFGTYDLWVNRPN